jgi:hypothetical protein
VHGTRKTFHITAELLEITSKFPALETRGGPAIWA